MATTHIAATVQELDAIAYKFLGSEFTERIYSNWSIEQRIDAYLVHGGLMDVLDDAETYEALLERVMANIGPAIRLGVLPPPSL